MTRLTQAAVALFFLASFPLSAQDKAAEAAWKKNTEAAKKAFSKNQYTQANDLYEAALVEALKFPPDDARLSETWNELSFLRRQLNDSAGAEVAQRRALVIDQKRLGTNDYRLIDELLNLGSLCAESKRYEEADVYSLRAQNLAEKKFGKYDRIVGICLEYRARTAVQDDRLEEAEKLYKQALEMIGSSRVKVNFAINEFATRSVLRPNKTQLAIAKNDLGLLYLREKKFPEAEAMLKESLSLMEDQYGKNNIDLCNILNDLAITDVRQNKLSEAEAMLRRSLANLKSVDQTHPMVIATRQLLDEVLQRKSQAAQIAPSQK